MPGGGRTETKHDLVGGAHTAAHCFPLGDAGLDPARALRRSWGLGGPACLRGLRGRFGRSGVQSSWKAPRLRGSGHGVREGVGWPGNAGGLDKHKRVLILGAPSEISCAWVPREPPGVSPPRPLLAPRCGKAVASGPGSMRKLQAPHQRQHPLWFSPIFFLLSSPFPGQQRGERPREEKTYQSACQGAQRGGEPGCDPRHSLSPAAGSSGN